MEKDCRKSLMIGGIFIVKKICAGQMCRKAVLKIIQLFFVLTF